MSRGTQLSDREILVLTSLAGGAKHGYALIGDIEQFSDARLGAGTLYAALSRLEQAGMIRALPAQQRRHPYEITALGRERLAARLEHTAQIARLGLARLGPASA